MASGIGAEAVAKVASSAPRLKHIEGMRAVAALVVFVNHAYAQIWERAELKPPDGALSIFSYSMVAGHLAVAVFISLSGFCLALPLLRSQGELGSTTAFLKRRARRILPPYYGALALSLGLIATIIGEQTGSLWDVSRYVTSVAVISHSLLLQNLFGTGSINYVFWSIALEFQLYLVFPLLIAAWKRWGPQVVVPVALVLGYTVIYLFSETRLYRANYHFLGLFALGALATHVALSNEERYARARERLPWAWLCAAALVPVVALSAYWGVHRSTENFPVLDLFVGVATCCALVLSTRSSDGLVARALSFAPLAFVGVFSYSLYLVHAPILQIIWQYGLRGGSLSLSQMFGVLMTLGLGLVLAGAYGFHRVFEEPFMRPAGQSKKAGLKPAGAASALTAGGGPSAGPPPHV
jgi:peptidoglycan/LPS O-acetylase OafA/YrhL